MAPSHSLPQGNLPTTNLNTDRHALWLADFCEPGTGRLCSPSMLPSLLFGAYSSLDLDLSLLSSALSRMSQVSIILLTDSSMAPCPSATLKYQGHEILVMGSSMNQEMRAADWLCRGMLLPVINRRSADPFDQAELPCRLWYLCGMLPV